MRAVPVEVIGSKKKRTVLLEKWRRSDLMVSALACGSSGSGSSPDWGHSVVFLGMISNSHRASLCPGV